MVSGVVPYTPQSIYSQPTSLRGVSVRTLQRRRMGLVRHIGLTMSPAIIGNGGKTLPLGPCSELSYASANFVPDEGSQCHPIGIADLGSNLIHAVVAGP